MNKIQDFDATFYSRKSKWRSNSNIGNLFSFSEEFRIVVCGLDSVVARRWINSMLVNYRKLSISFDHRVLIVVGQHVTLR